MLMANPYSIEPPNVLQAILAGQQGYDTANKRAQENAIAEAAPYIAKGDFKAAAAAAGQYGGNLQAILGISSLGHQQQTEQLARDTFNNLKYTQTPAYVKQHAEITARAAAEEAAPVSVAPGHQLYNRKGELVGAPNDTGLYGPDELSQLAHQGRQGDTSVFTNARIGDPRNLPNLRKKIAEINAAAGESGAEQAQRNAEYFGNKAGPRVLGTQEAKMGSAAFEAEGAIDLARNIVDKVPRTSLMPLNKLIQGYQQQTLNPDQVELHGRLTQVANTYAAVMNRGANITTDTARSRADALLNSAGNAETLHRAMDTMQSEINMAKKSPERMRQFYRQQYGYKSNEDEKNPAPAKTITSGATPAETRIRPQRVRQNGVEYELQPDGSYK